MTPIDGRTRELPDREHLDLRPAPGRRAGLFSGEDSALNHPARRQWFKIATKLQLGAGRTL
ncbi:hypothetical protein [Prosthecobacter sp.]|uniref:hypothetical protein n=1 Tax=Prosthecobacter sp. TaxID=1965333 RepID=UPI0037848866